MMIKQELHVEKWKSYMSPYTKITQMDQGPQHKNLLEEKVGNRLGLIGPAKDFLNRTLIPQTLNPTIKR